MTIVHVLTVSSKQIYGASCVCPLNAWNNRQEQKCVDNFVQGSNKSVASFTSEQYWHWSGTVVVLRHLQKRPLHYRDPEFGSRNHQNNVAHIVGHSLQSTTPLLHVVLVETLNFSSQICFLETKIQELLFGMPSYFHQPVCTGTLKIPVSRWCRI